MHLAVERGFFFWRANDIKDVESHPGPPNSCTKNTPQLRSIYYEICAIKLSFEHKRHLNVVTKGSTKVSSMFHNFKIDFIICWLSATVFSSATSNEK